MPCSAATLLADGCANFGCLSETQLLQAIAQQATTWLVSIDPTADIDADAIFERACDSGFACASEVQLYQSIAQDLCGLIDIPCDTPPAPTNLTIFGGGNAADWLWDYGTDPALDFLLEWGPTPGGPYIYTDTDLASSRAHGTLNPDEGVFYGVVVARTSLACVSAPSNEVQFTII